MKPPSSRIRALLRARQLPTILRINLSDPRVIEIAALCGVDAVWLCTEHVPNDWLNLENQIRADRVHGLDTLVRVGRGSYSDYIRPFETGATGIAPSTITSASATRTAW
jgi:4-hydroxy-2-oxoheptanedioate aldolase